jgi:hypothetical protein
MQRYVVFYESADDVISKAPPVHPRHLPGSRSSATAGTSCWSARSASRRPRVRWRSSGPGKPPRSSSAMTRSSTRAWSRPGRCRNGTRSLARFERVPSRLRSRRPTCLNKPPSCVGPAATVRARPTKRMLNTPDRSTRSLRAATDCFVPGALRRVSLSAQRKANPSLGPRPLCLLVHG